ncbi:MAG: hypothetical protein IT246_02645 [Bacteroidia bacterium]|nr:hypothetical protein [Bacteroidia bacterium]
MEQRKNKIVYAILLLIVLFAISLLKDVFTPDYRNTPNADFLNPVNLQTSRIETLFIKPLFWLGAMFYSLVFLALPTLIIHILFGNKSLTKFTFALLAIFLFVLYSSIFINSAILDEVLVSKVNRYVHSPILTLFFIAAFKITMQKNE